MLSTPPSENNKIQQISESKKAVSILGVSNNFKTKFLSQPIQMTLGFFSKNKSFLLCEIAPDNLLGKGLLSKLKGLMCFTFKGDLTLEFP